MHHWMRIHSLVTGLFFGQCLIHWLLDHLMGHWVIHSNSIHFLLCFFCSWNDCIRAIVSFVDHKFIYWCIGHRFICSSLCLYPSLTSLSTGHWPIHWTLVCSLLIPSIYWPQIHFMVTASFTDSFSGFWCMNHFIRSSRVHPVATCPSTSNSFVHWLLVHSLTIAYAFAAANILVHSPLSGSCTVHW